MQIIHKLAGQTPGVAQIVSVGGHAVPDSHDVQNVSLDMLCKSQVSCGSCQWACGASFECLADRLNGHAEEPDTSQRLDHIQGSTGQQPPLQKLPRHSIPAAAGSRLITAPSTSTPEQR